MGFSIAILPQSDATNLIKNTAAATLSFHLWYAFSPYFSTLKCAFPLTVRYVQGGCAISKADQIIQPYEYGHHARKSTCLWLKNLPKLQPTNIVDPGRIDRTGHSYGASSAYAVDENGKILSWNDPRTAKIRSKTYPGIAKAMAEQWGELI